jgi:hypothetical protein
MKANPSKVTSGEEKTERKDQGNDSKTIDPRISKIGQELEEKNFQKNPKKTQGDLKTFETKEVGKDGRKLGNKGLESPRTIFSSGSDFLEADIFGKEKSEESEKVKGKEGDPSETKTLGVDEMTKKLLSGEESDFPSTNIQSVEDLSGCKGMKGDPLDATTNENMEMATSDHGSDFQQKAMSSLKVDTLKKAAPKTGEDLKEAEDKFKTGEDLKEAEDKPKNSQQSNMHPNDEESEEDEDDVIKPKRMKTRPRKNKIASSDSDEDGPLSGVSTTIATELRKRGLEHVDVAPSGNCLYLAISHAVYGNSRKWQTVRKVVAAELTKNRQNYAIPDDELDHIIETCKVSFEYGDQVEMTAASNAYGRPIEMWMRTVDGENVESHPHYPPQENSIALWYNGLKKQEGRVTTMTISRHTQMELAKLMQIRI